MDGESEDTLTKAMPPAITWRGGLTPGYGTKRAPNYPKTVSNVWMPLPHEGRFCHFIVTRYSHGDTRVAVSICNSNGAHLSNRLDHSEGLTENVDERAQWFLDPEAFQAYKKQRAEGWIGECLP